jgi:hypothetical protein
MRIQSLLALTTASVLLLPLSVQAGAWPPGKKGDYLDQCITAAAAQPGMTMTTAKKHCDCGANAIEKNFTTREIEQLDSRTGVDAALVKRAQDAVRAACAPQK